MPDRQAQHTPGPWEWVDDRFWGGYSGLFTGDGQPIIYPQRKNDGDEGAAWFDTCGDAGDETLTEANARLIAASPTMYEYINEKARQGCKRAQKIIGDI